MSESDNLVITEVHINLIKPSGGLIALAKVVLNNAMALDSIGIHRKLAGGYRLTYPTKAGHYLFHPIAKPLSELIEQSIFDELSKKLKVVNDDRHGSLDPAS